MEKEYQSQNYQENAPADKGFVLLWRLISEGAGFESITYFGFCASIRVEHCKENEYEGAESENGTHLVTHHGQRCPNGKIGNRFQVFGIINSTQSGNYGA